MSESPFRSKVEDETRSDSDGNEHASSTGDEFTNEGQLETSNSLLSTSSNAVVPPKGHPSVEISEEAKEKCPYFSMQKLKGPSNPPLLTNPVDPAAMSSSSEDEEGNPKRPKGGCPFLPSDRKKNPGLQHPPQTYSTRYQSRYAAYLDEDTLLPYHKDKPQKFRKNRRVFENYPIYLKHTLFHDDDIMQRIRKKDVVERFFAYDKYRERGNRLYNKQRYSEAIFLYERAFSCFRWLELKEKAEDKDAPIREKMDNKNKIQKNNKTNTEEVEEEEKKESTVFQKNDRKQKGSSLWYTEDDQNKSEIQQDSPNDADDSLHSDKDNIEQIKEYKRNDGQASQRINSLITQRANELSEQEAQREALLKKRMQQAQSGTPTDDQQNSSRGDSGSDRGMDSQDDDDSENGEKEEREVLERIAKINEEEDINDAKSLSVEGFDDGSERNFSSESEKEIDIEEITEKSKDPSETVIIMDEDEKRRMIADELFLRKNEKEDEEFRRKYRLFITTFNDDNILLIDGEGLVDSNDIDLRHSMIVSALLSLGLCYMNMGNFSEAMQAFNEAQGLHQKGSIPLMRKVQCTIANSASSYSSLLEAQTWFEQAKSLKLSEKIFNSGNATLVVMNVMNHVEFFEELRVKLETRTAEAKDIETERIREMIERVVELTEIEAEMIERGITPSDHLDDNSDDSVITLTYEQTNSIDDDDLEIQLSQIIESKYYAIMEGQMYAAQAESGNNQKLERTTNDLRKFYETLAVMDFYSKLEFKNPTSNSIIRELANEYNVELTKKNIRRLEKIKRETIKETFNETQHNFTIYKWALDEYFERRKQRKLKADKKAKQISEANKPPSKPSRVGSLVRSTLFGKSSLIQFILIFILFYLLVLYLRSSATSPFSLSVLFQN